MANDDKFFSEIYKYSPIGLVILDSSTYLVNVNEYMSDSFSLVKSDCKGKKFGNIFGCSVVAGTDRICGKSEACETCDLRRGISNVLSEDAVMKDVTISHPFMIGGVHSVKWFKISASAVDTPEGKYAIASFVDISKEKQYEQMLQRELTLDAATGAVNKKNLLGILMDLSRYTKVCDVVSVCIIDMDDFKNINDTYGHLKGDEVLQSFSDIAKSHIRKNDILGRYGGEEFMLVFPGICAANAVEIIQRMHEALHDKFKEQLTDSISFSAGLMEMSDDELGTLTEEQIIETVDGYLYKAKNLGRQMLVSRDITVRF